MVVNMITHPEINDLNKFPLCTATAIPMKNPIVAKSPNGRIVFPGTMIAIKIVNGMKISPTVTTSESPRMIAGSSQTEISLLRFLSFFLIMALIRP